MAHTVTETRLSQVLAHSRPGELQSWRQDFLVDSDGAGGSPSTSFDVAQMTGIPVPKVTRYAGSTWSQKQMVCQAVEIIPEDRPYLWRVRVLWTSRATASGCFVRITRTAGVRMMPRWRTGSPIALGAAAWPPTATEQVGGTKVDMRGSPNTFPVPTQQITIEEMFDPTHLLASSGSPFPDYQAQVAAYAFHRNTTAWLGWAAGKLLYLGADESPVDDLYRNLTSRYLADEYFHLDQRAIPGVSGKVNCQYAASPWSDAAATEMQHADNVVWYQPYPDTADLSWALLTSCARTQVDTPGPTNYTS